MRFSNDADYKMETVELTLTQLDARGNVLTTTPVCLGIFLAAGKTAAIDRGIPVVEKCVDFRVRVESVRSGEYVYRERGGIIVADYVSDPVWHMDPADARANNRKRARDFEARSKQGGIPRLVGLAAALCALALLASAVWGFLSERIKTVPLFSATITDVNP